LYDCEVSDMLVIVVCWSFNWIEIDCIVWIECIWERWSCWIM